ncbi:MAG: YihY/virulence factor BrkB family protein [Clostridiaceae bacterium]|nr:YihY/virulence factor BrkB family protein [Clostridiaceae bacterium]
MKDIKTSKINLFIQLIVKIKKDDIFALGAELAYYLVLSFLPFLIFLITLIGFANLDKLAILEALHRMVPTSVYDLTQNIINEVVGNQNTGLLGVSIVITIWTASSGFRAVIKGVNKAYDVEEKRSYIKRAIISFFSIIALALAILSTLIIMVFGNVIGEYLLKLIPYNKVITAVWNMLRSGLVIIAVVFVIAAIYRYAPSKKVKWRDVIPGSIICTLGWICISTIFSFYINNYSNYSRVYGSLAAVFILMIWLYLVSMILIFGVEVNSILSKNKEIKKNK